VAVQVRKLLSNVSRVFRKIPVQWKVAFIVLVALILLIDVVLNLTTGPSYPIQNPNPGPKVSEISPRIRVTTIRNVTDQTIDYTIKPLISGQEPKEKTLEAGAIDHFPTDVSMDVIFQRSGHKVWHRIDAGTPYSFRYDENGELDLFIGSHGRGDAADLAPFVPTPMTVVEKMLELAEVDKNDVVYDLGCGDGRIVIMAADKYGAHGVGIDIDPVRINESREAAERDGVKDLVEFRLQDVMKADISQATVVTIYLLTESNAMLRPQLERQLKPRTYVVSHNYSIPGWKKKLISLVTLEAEDGEEHDIYLYRR
jgi:SAM-dependent methyltransferase